MHRIQETNEIYRLRRQEVEGMPVIAMDWRRRHHLGSPEFLQKPGRQWAVARRNL